MTSTQADRLPHASPAVGPLLRASATVLLWPTRRLVTGRPADEAETAADWHTDAEPGCAELFLGRRTNPLARNDPGWSSKPWNNPFLFNIFLIRVPALRWTNGIFWTWLVSLLLLEDDWLEEVAAWIHQNDF
jgi:hypothetical protein